MPNKMRALRKYAEGKGNVEIQEVEVPKIGPDEALVKVKGVTVDQTDVDIWHWRDPMGVEIDPDEIRFMGSSWVKIPVTLGAEIAGTVEELGENVTDRKIGDRVVIMYGLEPCGECVWCKQGYYEICEAKVQVGRMTDGGFAKYIKVPAESLVTVPENVTLEEATPVEMVVTAWHSFVMCGIDPGDFVVIQGPGVVGNYACQIGKALGAETILVTGVEGDEERLNLAKELGADIAVNVSDEDLYEVVMDKTDGKGADRVLDFTGNPSAIAEAFDIVRVQGTIHCTGNPRTGVRGEVTIPWLAINAKELTITGSKVWRSRKQEWERALAYISDGRVQTTPLIQSHHTLEEWQEAFDKRDNKESLLPFISIS